MSEAVSGEKSRNVPRTVCAEVIVYPARNRCQIARLVVKSGNYIGPGLDMNAKSVGVATGTQYMFDSRFSTDTLIKSASMLLISEHSTSTRPASRSSDS